MLPYLSTLTDSISYISLLKGQMAIITIIFWTLKFPERETKWSLVVLTSLAGQLEMKKSKDFSIMVFKLLEI